MNEVFHSAGRPIKSKEPFLDRFAFIFNIWSESKISQFKAYELDLLEATLVLHIVLNIFSYRSIILWLENLIIVIRIVSAIFSIIISLLVWHIIILVILLKCSLLGSLFQQLFFSNLLFKHILELVDSRFV